MNKRMIAIISAALLFMINPVAVLAAEVNSTVISEEANNADEVENSFETGSDGASDKKESISENQSTGTDSEEDMVEPETRDPSVDNDKEEASSYQEDDKEDASSDQEENEGNTDPERDENSDSGKNDQSGKETNPTDSSGEVEPDLPMEVQAVTYGAYTGIDYTSLTSNPLRIAALNKARDMVTVQWYCPQTFRTWYAFSSGGGYNSVTATDGSSAQNFVAGKTYQGIPYTMVTSSQGGSNIKDDNDWAAVLNGGVFATT